MHYMQMHYMKIPATAAVALTLIAGCANPPPPIADLTQARTLVTQAQDNGAPRYDSTDLAAAQDKLHRADADARSNPSAAAQLAQESSVDAQLALARTRANKEQESLTQVNDSLAALHRQMAESQIDETAPAATTQSPPNGSGPEGGSQQ